MDGALEPYLLPDMVLKTLQDVAAQSDVLILGELHGTQEVPRLVQTLLPSLAAWGYGALALEIDADQHRALVDWAMDRTQPAPPFFAQPSGDGRGNVQVLSLVQTAVNADWQLLCFDMASTEPIISMENFWQQRDAAMARNMAAQRQAICPDAKVLVVCGNMHARLFNHAPEDSWAYPLWPSFAAMLREQQPTLVISAINIDFGAGEYYNGGRINSFDSQALDESRIDLTENTEFTLTLRLPTATAVTFLHDPIQEE